MKKLSIEWKHYDKKGETCLRCNNTGLNINISNNTFEEIPKSLILKAVEKELSNDY